MRILFVVDNLGAGGAERSLQELLPELALLGVRSTVACFQRRQEGVERLVEQEHDLRLLAGNSRLQQMRALRQLVHRERIELVHTTLFQADVFGRTAVFQAGAPVVTSLVNMPYESARLEHDRRVNRTKLAIARSLEIATGKLFADHFHAISQAVKDTASRRLWIASDKISVVHRGRDPFRLGKRGIERRLRVRHDLGIADEIPLILSAGRQEFQKGQGFLIGALADLLRELPTAQVLIAGRAGNASTSLQQAAQPFRGHVRFLGHRDDLPELMAAADFFALPSLWEGLGCVVLEAMALELPIVASDLAPVREVVGVDAELVTPANSRDLARGLLRLHSDPERTRGMAVRARNRFERDFTIARSAAGMFELFEGVLRRSRARHTVRAS